MRKTKKGFLKKTEHLVRFAIGQHVTSAAAHASFFLILSVFPSLMLVLALLRYTGLEVETLTQVMTGVVPDALMPYIERLIQNIYADSTTALVGISAVTALWSASRGVFALLMGLNTIYGVSERRSYWFTRLISVFYTFLLLVVLLMTLTLHVFGTSLLELIPERDGVWLFLSDIIDFRFFLLFLLQTALFCAIFMVLPNRRNSFSGSLPGALLSAIGWLVFSDIYSIYVERFATYTNIYGSVYAVALSMLWLYCCMSIVFYGGVLNRWLMFEREEPVNKE